MSISHRLIQCKTLLTRILRNVVPSLLALVNKRSWKVNSAGLPTDNPHNTRYTKVKKRSQYRWYVLKIHFSW